MKKNPLVAACTFDLTQSTNQKRLVLLPDGSFKGADGRPYTSTAWSLTAANGQAIAAAMNSKKIDTVIDYEHATLKAAETGQAAPAAGWLHAGSFEYIPSVGLVSNNFSWTTTAGEMIAANEYKYLSPVFRHLTSGEVTTFINLSLTNVPNIEEMPQAMLAAATRQLLNDQPNEEPSMEALLEQLRWMLNLPLSATAEEITAELGKLQIQISEKTGVAVAANSKNLFDALAVINKEQLAANSKQLPDPTKFAPIAVVTGLQAQINELLGNQRTNEVETLITAACSDGRLRGEEMTAWAREMGKQNPDYLKNYLSAIPAIPALAQRQTEMTAANRAQHEQKKPASATSGAVFAALGVSAEDIAKYGAQA